MAAIRESVEQDYVIEHLRDKFQCTVLWCEGRAVLEYASEEQLDHISDYVQENFDKGLMDVFFTAIEGIPVET